MVVTAGVPGTGKTATVKQVMRYMLENKEDFPEFTFHEINGMRLTCPEQVPVHSFTIHMLHAGEHGRLS
jgi:Cdc6-like AAA superfamily ATPase